MASDNKTGSNGCEEQALSRYRALLPYLQGIATLEAAADAAGVTSRTLRRWLQRLETRGFAGLKVAKRSDAGQRKVPQELQAIIEGLFLSRPPLQISSIHRKIRTLCAERGWNYPSYSTVFNIAKALPASMVTLAHEGAKAYRNKFDLVLTREAERPNEIWQADHKELDMLVQADGKSIKPWLTAIIDDYSRAVSGYFIGADAPSVLRTSLALRQGIWRKSDSTWAIAGTPDYFYVDHGCDFTSRHLEQVAADLRITLIFSNIGEPRGRGKIERFFRSVNQLFCAGLPGYLDAGAVTSGKLLTLEEFEEAFHKWLTSDYMQREHSEIGMSPLAKWTRAEIVPRLPVSLEQLDLLLLTVKKNRSIRSDGIHFNRLRYNNVALGPLVGRPATIRYDPRCLQEIKVYLDDEFYCTARCDEKMSIKELIQARNRVRKNLEREINARSELIKLYMESSGYSDGVESTPASELAASPSSNGLKIYATDIASTNT